MIGFGGDAGPNRDRNACIQRLYVTAYGAVREAKTVGKSRMKARRSIASPPLTLQA